MANPQPGYGAALAYQQRKATPPPAPAAPAVPTVEGAHPVSLADAFGDLEAAGPAPSKEKIGHHISRGAIHRLLNLNGPPIAGPVSPDGPEMIRADPGNSVFSGIADYADVFPLAPKNKGATGNRTLGSAFEG